MKGATKETCSRCEAVMAPEIAEHTTSNNNITESYTCSACHKVYKVMYLTPPEKRQEVKA